MNDETNLHDMPDDEFWEHVHEARYAMRTVSDALFDLALELMRPPPPPPPTRWQRITAWLHDRTSR